MKFRPLGDRVVVRRVKEEEQDPPAASSFPKPRRRSRRKARSSPSAPAHSTITASACSPEVKAGDHVLFGKWSGTEVKIDGEELLIMKESDIMGIVERPQASSKKAA